jgi:hypothetical protein
MIDLLRNRLDTVDRLASLMDRTDGDAIDDVAYIGDLLAMLRRYLDDDAGILKEKNMLQLAALAIVSETLDPDKLGRVVQMREFLLMTRGCRDERFAELVTGPLDNRSGAIKPAA